MRRLIQRPCRMAEFLVGSPADGFVVQWSDAKPGEFKALCHTLEAAEWYMRYFTESEAKKTPRAVLRRRPTPAPPPPPPRRVVLRRSSASGPK